MRDDRPECATCGGTGLEDCACRRWSNGECWLQCALGLGLSPLVSCARLLRVWTCVVAGVDQALQPHVCVGVCVCVCACVCACVCVLLERSTQRWLACRHVPGHGQERVPELQWRRDGSSNRGPGAQAVRLAL